MATFKARVGVQSSVDPSKASYARSIRNQMKAIEKNLAEYITEVKGITQQVLHEALAPTFNKSQKYCPVDTGAMKASGYIEITGRGKNIHAEIGYGKHNNPPYTSFVHEMTNNYHKPPTRAKWLQVALEEDMDKFLGRIKRAYRERMRK